MFDGKNIGKVVSSKSDVSNQGKFRKYDHIIIIPVYNEAVDDVLRVIHSVAMQNYKKGYTVERAIVVNINNTANESKNSKNNSIAYKRNLLIYNFLRKIINLEKYFNFKNDLYFLSDKHERKLRDIISDVQKKIRDKLLHIEIIDSFSLGNAQEENTLGLARETGFRFAANYLASSEKSLLFSTDADSMFGLDTMNTVEDMFLDNEVDFAPLNLDYHFENLDDHFVRAAIRYRLSRNILANLFTLMCELKNRYNPEEGITISILLEKAFDLGGAFTVMRVGSYIRSSGYPSVSSKEDLYIAASVAGAGGKLKDLRKKYPLAIVYTSPRISYRVPEGYGRKIEKFVSEEIDFLNYSVANVEAHLSLSFLIRKIEIIKESGKEINSTVIKNLSKEICPWLIGIGGDNFLNDLLEIFSHKSILDYSKEHWDLSNKTKKLLRSDFVPQQTILEQINMLEKICYESFQIFFTDSDLKLIERYRNIWNYFSLKNFLLNRSRLIKDLDIDLIMPIIRSQIVNMYIDVFVRDFKANIIPILKKRCNTLSFRFKKLINFFKKDKRGPITIEKFLEYEDNNFYRNLLLKCEVRLFTAIRQGYKGIISESVDSSISEHINKISRSQNS